jgi:hypothetical protein
MSAYDDLYSFAQDWVARQNLAKTALEEVINHFVKYCGIPYDRVRYLPWNDAMQVFSARADETYAFFQACHFDNAKDEWAVGVSISLATPGVTGRAHAKIAFTVRVKGNESDFVLTFGALRPQTVPYGVSGWEQALFDAAIDDLKKSFTNPSAKGTIGFRVELSE